MRRWVTAAAVMLAAAVLAGLWITLPARRAALPGGSTSMAAMGLVLLEDDAGLYVLGVIDDGLASSAGICPGDRLTALRDTTLTTVAQFETLLADQERGLAFPLTLSRQEQSVTVSLTLQ